MTTMRLDLGHVPVESLDRLSLYTLRAAGKACVNLYVESTPIYEGWGKRRTVKKHHVMIQVSSTNTGSVRDYVHYYLVNVLAHGFTEDGLYDATEAYMHRLNAWYGEERQTDV
jgi:hypothetical protein